MTCPLCGSQQLECLWSQSKDNRLPKRYAAYNIIRRRRACKKCNHLFWTIEANEEGYLMLLDRAMSEEMKRNRREPKAAKPVKELDDNV